MTKAKRSSRSASRRPRQSVRSASRASARPLITTVIFDLDDTLYDCFGQRVRAAHFRAAEAMASAGLPASAEEVFQVRMQAFAGDRKSTRLNSSHMVQSRMPSSA